MDNYQEHDLESSTSTMSERNPFIERNTDELINIGDNNRKTSLSSSNLLVKTSGTSDIASSRSLSNSNPSSTDSYGMRATKADNNSPYKPTVVVGSVNQQAPSTTTKTNVVDTKKRVHFKSLLATITVINNSDEIARHQINGGQELINFNNLNLFDESTPTTSNNHNNNRFDDNEEDRQEDSADADDEIDTNLGGGGEDYQDRYSEAITAAPSNHSKLSFDDGQETINDCDRSPSRYKYRNATQLHQTGGPSSSSVVGRLTTKLKFVTSGLANKILGPQEIPYAPHDSDKSEALLTGTTKYKPTNTSKRFRRHFVGGSNNTGRTFRGSYKYSRTGIVMAIFKKLISFLFQKSTLALIGAFLIHVTLGTVYTLSNINSYLTSYMRKHGTPSATYGGSMWISSSYAVGQGISMVLGGYLERRFSARLSCFLGCALHSISIMSTSKSIDHGHLAVLVTYGFLPGFGCGLAYMTPMSNGFGWFPNRKGLVAGVILAGFGIGTFVFNMAQTAFVNPQNLSPLADAGGYFTQTQILDRVPHLFVFLGTIYAAMQFIGCCLLFKPPSSYDNDPDNKSSDTKPILVEAEMSFQKAVRSREFIVLFLVFGITNQGVLFVNSMLKEYGQIFINNDLFLAWTGSMASIANSMGRLSWGLAIDRFSFTQCFTAITTIFGTLMFLMPFEFVLSSKLLYLLCTLGIFGSFSGWMSTYPVHLSRIFGVRNSGMIYGLIFVSQSIGGIFTAFGAHYLIDNYSRFVPFFCVTFLELLGLAIYHLFYNK